MGTRKVKRKAKPASSSGRLTKPVHQVRLSNLRVLVDKRYEGNATAFARALGRSQNFIWQLLNRERAMGEKTARYIEEVLGFAHLQMDETQEFTPRLHCDVQRAAHERVVRYLVVPRVERVDIVTLLSAAVLEEGAAKVRAAALAAQAVLPCPVPCSDRTLAFEAWTKSLEPLVCRGDIVFVDPVFRGDAVLNLLTDERIYVVVAKRVKDAQPLLRVARGPYDHGFVFTEANEKSGVMPAAEVKVLGRVIATMKVWKEEEGAV